MKKVISYLSIVTLSVAVLFTSCKKDNSSQSGADNTAQVTTQSDDQSRVSEETDAVSNDVNASIENSSVSISGGRVEDLQGLICDATITLDTVANPKVITITYNGNNCAGTRTRTGSVTVTIAGDIRWKNAGAVITVKYNNLKITRLLDNKSITINGTHTITNVSGGLLYNLANLPSITHTITSSNMSITFDDGSQRTWSVARQRVFTYNNGIVITTTGTHTEGAETGIEEWGTTRFGGAFTNSIKEPIVIRQDCSFRIVSGTFKHVSPLATTTVVFGLNSAGNATSCPGTGSYYFKATWTGIGGKTVTVILPY